MSGPMIGRAARGVTLLDTMVAIGLLTVGGAGLLAMELVAVGANGGARQITEATTRAQEQMERLSYALSPPPGGGDTVDAYGCSSASACVQRGPVYTRAWTVGTGVPVVLVVTVSWSDTSGRPHGVVLNGQR